MNPNPFSARNVLIVPVIALLCVSDRFAPTNGQRARHRYLLWCHLSPLLHRKFAKLDLARIRTAGIEEVTGRKLANWTGPPGKLRRGRLEPTGPPEPPIS